MISHPEWIAQSLLAFLGMAVACFMGFMIARQRFVRSGRPPFTEREVAFLQLDGSFALGKDNLILRLKTGSSEANVTYVGQPRELCWIRDTREFVIHDGHTPGGALHFRCIEAPEST